jgi:DNA polymerase III delta prime subunit
MTGGRMLSPPEGGRREKLMLMGPPGTGKTSAWLNIAKWAHATGSPSKFYVLDTDNALDAFLEPGGQYADLDWRKGGNVEWQHTYEWEEYDAALKVFQPKLTHDDWLIVDFISPAWDAVQGYYVAEVFKSGIDDYFLNARKLAKGGNPLDGWTDWSVINRLYKKWMNELLHRTPGHKFFTAEVEGLRDTDDKGIKATYGAYGVRPRGQKQLGHQTHTTLLCAVDRSGDRVITTIKDRERLTLERKVFKEFAVDYLATVAGWQL